MHEVVRERVSRETYLLLERYIDLLMHWNQKVNLISRRVTKEELWRDHVLDSLLLSDFIQDKDALLIDVGSGAGFPGMILAINSHSNCVLVERNAKKSSFLKAVAADLSVKVRVKNECITQLHDMKADYICSRAVARIEEVISLTDRVRGIETEYVLHTSYEESEILALRKTWNFELQEYINPYKRKCKIVSIKNVSRREI